MNHAATVPGPEKGRLSFPAWMMLLPLAMFLLLWVFWLLVHGGRQLLSGYAGRTLGAVLLCASATTAGQWALSRITSKQIDGTYSLLLSFTTGLILYYHIVFLLGAIHAYNLSLLKWLCVVPALWHLRPARIRQIAELARGRMNLTSWEVPAICLLSFLISYSFLLSLNPVVYYDALANHLAVPREYLMRNGIESIPYNLHADLPPAAHIINLILIAGFGSGECVQIFNFLLVLFLGLAACCLTEKKNVGDCVPGYCIFLLIPQVSLLFSFCNIDFMVTLMCATSLVICFRLDSIGQRPAVILLALHISFLLALKYQSAIFVALLLACITARRSEEGLRIRHIPALLLLSGILDLPFLVKNYLYTGDPVFPFLSSVFPVSSVRAEEIGFFLKENGGHEGLPGIASYLQVLLHVFFRQPEMGVFVTVPVAVAFQYSRVQHKIKGVLLVIAIFPLLIHALVSSNIVNLIRWIQYSQFSLSILTGLCIAEGVRSKRFFWTTLFVSWITIAFILSFSFNWRLTQSLKVSTGILSEEAYRAQFIPSYSLRMKLSSLQGKILFIGESRGYYNAENSVIPSAHNSYYIERCFQNANSVGQLAQSFRKEGYRYLFVTVPAVNKLLQTGRYRWMTSEQYGLLQSLVRDRSIMTDGASIVVQLW